jgi:hypothetical protein
MGWGLQALMECDEMKAGSSNSSSSSSMAMVSQLQVTTEQKPRRPATRKGRTPG